MSAPLPVRLGVIAVAIAALVAASLTLGAADAAKRAGLSAYQLILRSEVDNAKGGPRAGNDPAAQRQTSLAAAARKPNGVGARVDDPAAGVDPVTVHRKPASVLPKPKATGVVSGGCVLGYGVPGDQCVPAVRPRGRSLTCGYLIRLFPTGVAVSGRDVLALDTNGDGVACGGGDAGVPRS